MSDNNNNGEKPTFKYSSYADFAGLHNYFKLVHFSDALLSAQQKGEESKDSYDDLKRANYYFEIEIYNELMRIREGIKLKIKDSIDLVTSLADVSGVKEKAEAITSKHREALATIDKHLSDQDISKAIYELYMEGFLRGADLAVKRRDAE